MFALFSVVFVTTIVVVVHGQLSVDELFDFHSKYFVASECKNFHYDFVDLRWATLIFNRIHFDCESSQMIFSNRQTSNTSFCPKDIEDQKRIRIDFRRSSTMNFQSQTQIEINQIHLYGIELASLDESIHQIYSDYAFYRSDWALLINIGKSSHVALTSNGEMVFLVFLSAEETPSKDVDPPTIGLIFPNENRFIFNQSKLSVWNVDRGHVRTPKTVENPNQYQLSKSRFQLFLNETFFIYGTQSSLGRRYTVTVDNTRAICFYDYLLRCLFPILPSSINDDHRPMLKVFYSLKSILNESLTLVPRQRLNHLPRNFTLMNITAFEVKLKDEICQNHSLKSVFHFIVHLWKEDVNGAVHYEDFLPHELPPMDCDQVAKIGFEIIDLIQPITIVDILRIDVDLSHQWYEQIDCLEERTRITFL